jgi:PAS domain S-box-containing protein
LLLPRDFMPHGYCYRWVSNLVWLHAISDSLIFLAYMTIPFTLIHIVRRRKDLPFNWIFVCFGIFIVACGITHAMEVWNLWHANYWLAGIAKAVTAAASILTAILLIRLVPQALTFPSAQDLRQVNQTLTLQGAAVRASELKFRGILESAPDAMIISDPHGRILLVNAETERLFGYRRDELVGQLVDILVPERFRTNHPHHRQGYTAQPHTRSMGEGRDLWGLRKDNTEFPVEISLSPIDTPDGTLISSAVRDVTTGKKAEQALRASELRFRGILESAPDAMVIADSQGRIVLLNAETERLFGYRREELIGQPVEILVPQRFRGKHPQHRQEYAAHPLTRTMGAELDLWALRNDGTEFPVEISLSPLETSEGMFITTAIRDISARKRAEAALQLSEERLSRLFQGVTDYAFLTLDTEGRVTSWNAGAERIKGYRSEEIIGKHFSNFYEAEAVASGLPPRELAAASEHGSYQDEGWRVRKDRSRFWASVLITALRDSAGRLLGYGKVVRDVTERRDFEEQLIKAMGELKRSNDELQQFAYVASHDLQEPLRMVASYTQLLAKRYTGRLDPDADEFIGYAVDGCTRMQSLIHDLLAFSRAGTQAKVLHETSSENALQEALKGLRTTIHESGALVTHDPLPTITTDDAQLAQVFQNLIANAIKYHGPDVPRVHVSATRNGGNEWTFSIRDNGLGIEAQYFERIFVLFQRLHGRGEFEGTGIGLAICKKILERLDGRIWVESQLGKGSTFFFALPQEPRNERKVLTTRGSIRNSPGCRAGILSNAKSIRPPGQR